MAVLGGPGGDAWRASFLEAAIPAQSRTGELSGSWDPVGPWGYAGGRIYSTAIMALGLLAPLRFQGLTAEPPDAPRRSRR